MKIFPLLYCTRILPSRLNFPWYDKIKRQLDDIEQRYVDLHENRCIRSPFANTTQDKYFILCRQRTTRCSSVFNSTMEKEFIPDDEAGNLEIEFFTTKQIMQKVDSGCVLVAPCKISFYFHNNKNLKCKIIFVATDIKEYTDAKMLFKERPNVKVSRLEEIRDIASLTLEESMFEPMKFYAERLDEFLQHNRKYRTRKDESVSNKIKEGRYRKTPYNAESKKVRTTRSKHLEKIKEEKLAEKIGYYKDSYERLYNEILGVFKRSRIPEHKKPNVRVTLQHKVGDEVSNELYKIDSSVKSCGYRYGTLQVFVDDVSKEEIKNSIKKVLKTNGINDFEIVPAISTYKSFLGVGAKACPDDSQYGSLGGYAKRNSSHMCALVSRHVAIHSEDMHVSLLDQHSSIRSKLIPETVPPDTDTDGEILDISACEIYPTDTSLCDTRFKSECGNPSTRKDFTYEDKQLDNRHVHLWGAVSKPGLGIITIPEVRDRNHDKTYIIVEDRANTRAVLGKRGDSGAMVCADAAYESEVVEPISMLIGEDGNEPGKYVTFRIDKGLEQLNKQTGSSFSLC